MNLDTYFAQPNTIYKLLNDIKKARNALADPNTPLERLQVIEEFINRAEIKIKNHYDSLDEGEVQYLKSLVSFFLENTYN